MKLIFVRHGDPDYEKDSLTEQGIREAKLLAPRIQAICADEWFVSPMGRARLTAELALEGTGIRPVELPWLKEFAYRIKRPDCEGLSYVPWDWFPQHWSVRDDLYDERRWSLEATMADGGIDEKRREVENAFDTLLKEHGYERDGRMYRAVRPNGDTLVFFCHFGLMTLLLSHLLSVSAMPMWQGFISAPTSLTTVITEERSPGNVQWRCTAFGDTSHLYAGGVEPAFSGRFCEQYTNFDERH